MISRNVYCKLLEIAIIVWETINNKEEYIKFIIQGCYRIKKGVMNK